FIFGTAWFFIHAFIIFPANLHSANGLPLHANRYTWLLSGDPKVMISYIFSADSLRKLGFLFKLFAPVLFVSFFAPLALIPSLPTFAFSLLSTYPPQSDIYMHYTAPIIPAIMVSAIYGVCNLQTWLKQRNRPLKLRPAMTAVFAAIL